MAESINRTVVIDGEDDGLAAMLQGIQSSTESLGQVFSRVMEKNSAAIDQMVKSMDGLLDRMEKVQKNASGGGGRAGFMGGMVGGGMMGGIAGGVGAGLGIASFMSSGAMLGTAFTEGRKLDEARKSIEAIRGISPTGKEWDTEFGDKRAGNIGVSQSDFLGYEANITRMRGMLDSRENEKERTLRTLQFERAYGLGEGETMGLHSFARSGGEEPAMVMARIFDKAKDSQLWDIKVDSKGEIQGFASLGEKMQQVTSMTTSMLRGSAKADTGRIVDILSAFGTINMDEFTGSRAIDTINALDQGIRNPSNQYMQAEIMTALQKANPQMDQFELDKLRQQGIYGEGSLDAILSHGIETYGEISKYYLNKITGGGLSKEAIDALLLALKENPHMFADTGGKDILKEYEDITKKTEERAGRVTGEVGKVEADVQNSLAAGGAGVINALAPKIQEMLKSIQDWIASGDMATFFEKVDALLTSMANMGETMHDIAVSLGLSESDDEIAKKHQAKRQRLMDEWSATTQDPSSKSKVDSILGITGATGDTKFIQEVVSATLETMNITKQDSLMERMETIKLMMGEEEAKIYLGNGDTNTIARLRDDSARTVLLLTEIKDMMNQ